ncbi:MAG: InlB B-repeat-containing protein [Treponematales bacterium]
MSTAADHTLYAHWGGQQYTVTFDANNGTTPSPASITVTYGSAYGSLASTSRENYTFVGWFTASSGGEQVTADTIVATAGAHTLYAHWTTGAVYTITYNLNGGTGAASGSYTVEDAVTLPTPPRGPATPLRAGMTTAP